MGFDYRPQPAVLQELSAGQLANRWQRAVRLWWWLRLLYGSSQTGRQPWCDTLPQPFRYGDVRSRLFAATHGQQDQCSLEILMTHCETQRKTKKSGAICLCQRSLQSLLLAADPQLDVTAWMMEMAHYTGLDAIFWEGALEQAPFAVVHRSLRDDLKALVAQGWLRGVRRGCYATRSPDQLPVLLPDTQPLPTAALSPTDTADLLRVLEDIAFVQPQLEVVIQRLWEHRTAAVLPPHAPHQPEPARRIFVHLDYILPEALQEQVDTHQQDIEHLWQQPDGGVIQFDTWIPREERRATVTVYPVCLHYVRRAKYLSAYGQNADGSFGWHNYRLDRIASERVRVLPWGDPQVPQPLKHWRDRGELPTPDQVQTQLDEAWGFNFYLPKAWLLMRFSPWFARWYVDNTERHPTFGPVDSAQLPRLMAQHVPAADRPTLAALVAARSPGDRYYAGWVRLGDINVTMRLRDWRPQGEVIAPLQLRHQMAAEANQEQQHYHL